MFTKQHEEQRPCWWCKTKSSHTWQKFWLQPGEKNEHFDFESAKKYDEKNGVLFFFGTEPPKDDTPGKTEPKDKDSRPKGSAMESSANGSALTVALSAPALNYEEHVKAIIGYSASLQNAAIKEMEKWKCTIKLIDTPNATNPLTQDPQRFRGHLRGCHAEVRTDYRACSCANALNRGFYTEREVGFISPHDYELNFIPHDASRIDLDFENNGGSK